LEKLIQFIQNWFHKFTAGQKRLFALVCTGVFVGFLTFFVIMSASGSDREKSALEPDKKNVIFPVPPEELFLPDEPDFIPGVMLERNMRLFWTEEDASAFWQDPLKFGEEQWRDKLEAAINEFLERVP